MRWIFVLLLGVACTGAPSQPTDLPPNSPDLGSPATLPWASQRDAAGRFTVDAPTALSHDGVRDLVVDYRPVRLYRALSRFEDPAVDIEVNWALFPDPPVDPPVDTDTDDSDIPRLLLPADASPSDLLPQLAAALGGDKPSSATIAGKPALKWQGKNFSKQWTGAVVLGSDRFYHIAVRNKGKERLTDAHERVLSSLVLIEASELSGEDSQAGQARIDEASANDARERSKVLAEARLAKVKAEAAKAKADAIARGERLPDEDIIMQSVLGQLAAIRCFDFSRKGARNLTVRVQVKNGEGKAIRVVESPFSMSNNQPAPKLVTDDVAACIRRSVAKMSFPMELDGKADVPVILGVAGF